MNIIMTWVKASRIQTVSLAVAVIIAGSTQVGWAALRMDVLVLAVLSAVGFQLVSNFANDYGDFKKNTDAHRPETYRSLSAGNLTLGQVRYAIVSLVLMSALAVVALVWQSPVSVVGKWCMFALGVLSVIAAVTYTMGKRPYGYYAMGDVMVFLFFGVVGVVGSYYLQGGDITQLYIWCVAMGFGCLSTSVLNINNMRDSENDRQSGKITVANLLDDAAMQYQAGLLIVATLAFAGYAMVMIYGFSSLLSAVCISYVLW